MADEIYHIHDKLIHTVLANRASATDLLQRHLPAVVSQALRWPTLTRLDRSFVDEHLRATEADFLYEVEHVSGDASVWIYVLMEHQSTPDKWMPLRLLRYCCRIWEMQVSQKPEPRELRPIVPLVLYQGRDAWRHSTEFADLFAASVRTWPGLPRFAHGLVDQSGLQPEEIQGELTVRLMQLVMLAAYHPDRPWQELVIELLDTLATLPSSGGMQYVRVFLLYLLQTQEEEALESFRAGLRRRAPQLGDDLMTYGQQLTQEGVEMGLEMGLEMGKIRKQVEIIENLLHEGVAWPLIERVTHTDEAQFQALKQRVAEMDA